jgi:predicted kinase
VIALMGLPGSGKTTIAERLARERGVSMVSRLHDQQRQPRQRLAPGGRKRDLLGLATASDKTFETIDCMSAILC